MKKPILILSAIALAGCQTTTSLLSTLRQNSQSTGIAYKSVFQYEREAQSSSIEKTINKVNPNHVTKNTPFSIIYAQDWYASALMLADSQRARTCQNTFGTDSISATEANINKLKKISSNNLRECLSTVSSTTHGTLEKLRNELIEQAIEYSDSNCNIRVDRLSAIESAGDSTLQAFGNIASTIGVAASDAMTSRAASGALGVANGIWGSAKNNFLAGQNFSNTVNMVNENREAKAETLRAKTSKKLTEWSISHAINDLKSYDNSCDFFN